MSVDVKLPVHFNLCGAHSFDIVRGMFDRHKYCSHFKLMVDSVYLLSNVILVTDMQIYTYS